MVRFLLGLCIANGWKKATIEFFSATAGRIWANEAPKRSEKYRLQSGIGGVAPLEGSDFRTKNSTGPDLSRRWKNQKVKMKNPTVPVSWPYLFY